MAIFGEFLTTVEVANILGVTDGRVRQFHSEARLRGTKLGTQLLFARQSVEEFKKKQRPIGRPKNSR